MFRWSGLAWIACLLPQTGLSPVYPRISKNVSETRLAGQFGEIRAGPEASLRLHRLPVRPQIWPGPPHSGPVANTTAKNTGSTLLTSLAAHVSAILGKVVAKLRDYHARKSF